MNYNFLSRIRVISALLFILTFLLITKLFFVQIIHHESYKDRADRQYATPATNIFERGSIFFKNKDGSLIAAAVTTSGFKVAINPKELVEPDSAYLAINGAVPIDQAQFTDKAAKKTDPYEEIAYHLTKEQADKITNYSIHGVYIYKENWRFYPGGDMAPHAIGFVGYKGDQYGGRTGLEKYYDATLSRNQQELYINFFAEIFSDVNKTLFDKSEKEGDIVTSIEPNVQAYLQKKMSEVSDEWHPDAVGGIIINPEDGTIYAMANLPSYDLNNFSKVKNVSILGDPIVENVYEFGSIVKPWTMAAGLDAGVVTAETKYDDKGFIILNNKQINNYDHKGRGIIPMQEVLNQSLNTGAVYVMQKLGKDKFKNYMLGYGIGEKTGIDLPAETQGLVDALKSNIDVEQATASFGQGIAFTLIEAARAFSVLGNGGKLITPHLVTEIKYTDGTTKQINYPPSRQVLKKETSEAISSMLVTVVDKALLGGKVKLDRYSVAAKTGTAQMSKGAGGGYYEDRFLHSFMGYFPAYNPKFLILLYNIYPKGAKYASETLTHPFNDMTKFLINYYDIPPDR